MLRRIEVALTEGAIIRLINCPTVATQNESVRIKAVVIRKRRIQTRVFTSQKGF